MKILIVDDEIKVCEIIGKFLKAKGFAVSKAHNGIEALEVIDSFKPEVVMLDIKMPKMDGVECLRQIKTDFSDTEVIMATATDDLDTAISCMQTGAFGYLHKPLNLNDLQMQIHRALEHRRLVLENRDYQENLERKVEERTKEVRGLHEKLKDSFLKSVRITMAVLESYDPFLAGHSKRVSAWTAPLGEALNLSKSEIFDLELAALLHEIGQVALPEKIKNAHFSELSHEEIKMLQQYPVLTQKILSTSEELQRAGHLIRHHQEHMDGSGFPDGLSGESIPLGSRILGTINAYDELMMRRRFTSETFPSDKLREDFVFSHLYKLGDKHFQRNIVQKLEIAVNWYQKGIKTKVLCTVDELKPGMVVASDLHIKDSGRLLIGKGNVLSDIHIMKLTALYKVKLVKDKIYVYRS